MAYQLRDYQEKNINQIRDAFHRSRRVMYQAGTGSGKTVTASGIIKSAVSRLSTIWFVAHRRELIEQSSKTFWEDGISNGILMAEHPYYPGRQVQVCSIDTIRERMLKNDKLVVPRKPDLIVIDEAHRSLSPSYLKLIEKFPKAFLLGLSATPVRSDGRGLGHVYGDMVQAPSVEELIQMGWLVRPRYFTGATADLRNMDTSNYDYAAGELEVRMNNAQLRGDVVEQWLRHGERRKTIVFASGVKHSIALMEDFKRAGVRAAHVDGRTLTYDRMDIFDTFRNSDEIEVLCNCNIATEGVDIPEVGCVQIATATKLISKYLQMGGRGLRTHEGSNKKDCIVIDHGSNIDRHGFLEDPVPWSLDRTGTLKERIAKVRDELPKIFTCDNCGCEFSGQVRCPECKTRLEVRPEHTLINTAEELIEVTRGVAGIEAAEKQKTYSEIQKRNFHAQLMGYAKEKDYSFGWVAHKYRAKFGNWPPRTYQSDPHQEPSDIVNAFVRGQNIAGHIRRRYREKQQEAANG